MINFGKTGKSISSKYCTILHVKLCITSQLLILMVIISGCGKPKNDSFKLCDTLEYHPYKLYLQKEPYSEIYVEVDSLENTKVTNTHLETIKEFLALHCEKEKITVVKDPPIILNPDQDNMPIEMISLLYTDGPKDPNSNCAYIHCFFYNKKDTYNVSNINPYVNANTATTAFLNLSYVKHDKKAHLHFIRHELGHILGLSTNTEHGDGSHCNNKCLMEAGVDVGIMTSFYKIFGQSNKGVGLCTDCKNDLELFKQNQTRNLSFRGPFLTRKAKDYIVLALPYFYLITQEYPDNTNYDWHKMLEEIQTELNNMPEKVRPQGKMKRLFGYHTDNKDSRYELSEDTELLLKISQDPVSAIREYAETQLNKKTPGDKKEPTRR